MIDESLLSRAERTSLLLRGLYTRHGYERFKMNKFEEYELYMKNKEFLVGDGVITFNEGGRLMALRPDVTLSILKNFKDAPGEVQKICYNENVYRIGASGSLCEIMQSGLECLGDLSTETVCEVVRLAAESISVIGGEYVLSLSHMGFITAYFSAFGLDAADREVLLGYLGSKNRHDIRLYCAEKGIDPAVSDGLDALFCCPVSPTEAPEALSALCRNEEMRAALDELRAVCDGLTADGYEAYTSVDFSVINSMKYYNGIVFRGFVRGIPEGILSGGQYDKLMRRMGKGTGAVGFAVYLDALDYMDGRK